LFTVNAYAAYLNYEPVTVTQPDGIILNIYASGDEFYNWLHDKDGYTIIQDEKSGYYCYAVPLGSKLTASSFVAGVASPLLAGLKPWLTIPMEEIYKIRQKFYNDSPGDMADAPKTGLINNLVVYIRFADENEFTDSSAYYGRMYNNNFPGANSMYNYFRVVSYKQLFVTTTFYPLSQNSFVASYQDTAIRAYFKPYNASSNPLGYTSSNKTEREHNLLKRASEYVASMVPDTLNLDGDNDGRVDNVCFIVYGSSTAWADLLWPHMWSLYSVSAYIRGKRVYTYNFQLQNSLKSSGVGVLCHEMFHSLGAPDLYHYTSNGISPMSRWDIMDASQNPPQHMCSHMKKKYGTWLPEIQVINAPGTYTMKYLLASSNNAYKIPSPYSSTEYFHVEFRRKLSTFENSLPGDGMLILRINSTLNGNANGPPDEVYCFRPGGTLTANGYPLQAHYCLDAGRTAINNTTNPSPFLMDGSQGGLNIYNIGTYLDTIISFTLGTPTGIEGSGIVTEYDLSQNYPNPFNPVTEISYKVAKRGFVILKVYDLMGREVSTLVSSAHEQGSYKVRFDAGALSSGIYFYKISADGFTDIKKMMLIK
ncbi:MAG: M6 family metalloprotease domain-containing protein, partial [Ignavibacteria bacterium]|nr:M6 family metalloprotease domain-containing protein [Ignavibacteria bacterium]